MGKKEDPFRDIVFYTVLKMINDANKGDNARFIKLIDAIEIATFTETPLKKKSPSPSPHYIISCVEQTTPNQSLNLSFSIERKDWKPLATDVVFIENRRIPPGGTPTKIGDLAVSSIFVSLYENPSPECRSLVEQLFQLAHLLSICVNWYEEEFSRFLKSNLQGTSKLNSLTKNWIEKTVLDIDLLKNPEKKYQIQICETKRVKELFAGAYVSSPRKIKQYPYDPTHLFVSKHSKEGAYSYLLKEPNLRTPGIIIEDHQYKHSPCWPKSSTSHSQAVGDTFHDLTRETTIAVANIIVESDALRDFFDEIPERTTHNINIPFKKMVWVYDKKSKQLFEQFIDKQNASNRGTGIPPLKTKLLYSSKGEIREVATIGIYYKFFPDDRYWHIHFFPNSSC